MAVGIPLFLVGLTRLIRILPHSLINLPNRHYWLSTERKNQSFIAIEGAMIWLGAATVQSLAGIFYVTVKANLNEQPLNDYRAYFMLGGYLAAVVGYIGWLLWRFRKL